MHETIEDFGDIEKLGQGFSSADPLQEIDIGDGSVPRPTFINANMEADQKSKVCALLREFVHCFAWNYSKMPGLSRDLVEHKLPIKSGFRPHKQPPRRFNSNLYDRIKEETNRLLKLGLFGHVGMLSGFLTLYPLKRKTQERLEYALILET